MFNKDFLPVCPPSRSRRGGSDCEADKSKSPPIETPIARIPDFADSRRKLFMLKFTRLLHTTVVSLKHNGRPPSCMQDGQKGEHHNVGTLGSSTLKIATNGCLGGEYIRRPLLCLQSAENYFYIISYLLPSSSAILRFIFIFSYLFLCGVLFFIYNSPSVYVCMYV